MAGQDDHRSKGCAMDGHCVASQLRDAHATFTVGVARGRRCTHARTGAQFASSARRFPARAMAGCSQR
jgi:hypothetical protein